MNDSKSASIRNVADLRSQARDKLSDGAVTSNYGGDVAKTIELLNDALATEIVCVLRYKFHYVAAQGIDSEAMKAEFLQHANEEQAHADLLAARINQLGGRPDQSADPRGSHQSQVMRLPPWWTSAPRAPSRGNRPAS